MAIRSGFFNSVEGDRTYDASRFAEYFGALVGNGIFPDPADNLQVVSNDDMTVTIKAGMAWINGYIIINDSDYILNIDAADGVLNRIDRVVARYDVIDREIRFEVKKGDFASEAVAQVMQRDSDAYELGLALINVAAGKVFITSEDITDTRLDNTVCGVVTSLLKNDFTVEEKEKLANVEPEANKYVLPDQLPPSIIQQDTNNRLVSDTEKSTWNNKASTALATTSANGLMSKTDKSKLNGIASGAQVNTVTSVAGKTGAVSLAKADVGLGSVLNYGVATTAEAQAGTSSTKYMTPMRVKEALQVLGDGNLYITGSYRGNNAATRTINLGFTPKLIFLITSFGRTRYSDDTYGGMFLTGNGLYVDGNNSVFAAEIVAGGFNVYQNYAEGSRVNDDSYDYYYLALK